VFAVAFPLFLISSDLWLIVNEAPLYEYGFDKRHIAEETGIPKDELMKVAHHLIRYFNGQESSPQVEVTRFGEPFEIFNEREIVHLRDVKAVIRFFYLLQWVTAAGIGIYLLALAIFRRRRLLRETARGLLLGGIGTLALIGLVGLWAMVNFDSLFRLFHHLGFRNDLWQLDPSHDYLIMLFPQGFFFDVALLLLGALAAEILLLSGWAWFYLRRKKDRPPYEPAFGVSDHKIV